MLWLVAAMPVAVSAQPLVSHPRHAVLDVRAVSDSPHPGKPTAVLFTLTPDPGWHTYWRNPGDAGVETRIDWILPDGVQAGAVIWQAPERIVIGDTVSYGYDGSSRLLVRLDATDQPTEVGGTVSWLVCKDICIPESASFRLSFDRADAPPAAAFHFTTARRYQHPIAAEARPDGIRLAIPAAMVRAGIEAAYFFPYDTSAVRHSADQTLAVENDGAHLNVPLRPGGSGSPDAGVLLLEIGGKKTYYEVSVQSPARPAENSGLWRAVALAFLGGLILNAMPCVFPILSLKALALIRSSQQTRAHVRQECLAYVGGVLASFLAIAGLLLLVRQSAGHVGWGFQLQEPVFVSVLAVVMFLLGLSLSGLLRLNAPLFNGSAAHAPGWKGSFATGGLAVLVATPCTAPFMAPAVGYALTQGALFMAAVFIGLGLGFALPLLLLALFPGWARFLPKPGAWMERFKHFMAFPLYASSVWLLWVVWVQGGTMAILPVAGAMTAAVLVVSVVRNRPVFWPLLALGIAASLLVGVTGIKPGKNTFSEQMIEELQAQRKPVFVNVTAAWCLICKVNEKTALQTRTVQRLFRERGIILVTADWTRADPKITRYLQKFGRAGVPMYVFYPVDAVPVILPQVLTPTLLQKVLKKH